MASSPIPDIVLGARQLKNTAGVEPRWDAPGSGPSGEAYGPPPTRLPKGVSLRPIPLVINPEQMDLSTPPRADIFPTQTKGFSNIRRVKK